MSALNDVGNPFVADNPASWDALIDSINPAALLVAIESRMSHSLKKKLSAEDVFQETLLHAWRDRPSVAWQGPRAFRSWLLSIADNRIRDLADREFAQKRGGDAVIVPFHEAGAGEATTNAASKSLAGMTSTTPSRAAIRREQAAAMSAALAALPVDVREVVRLRLFEQLTMEEIAGQLGIGLSAARHRFRKGAEEYQARLREHVSTGYNHVKPEK